MKSLIPPALALSLLLISCSRQESGTVPPSDQNQSDDPALAAESGAPRTGASAGYTKLADAPALAPDPSGAPAEIQAQTQAVEGHVHPFMTTQLRIFIREKGRMPESFSEFAGARMDSVPFAPEGMEYAIDYQNRQVKVVRTKK
jgi:hypothetical protein